LRNRVLELQQYLSHSSDETFEIGRKLGQELSIPIVVCFFGELAAGKTTFIKGLVYGAAQMDPSIVQSPTFTYLNIYEGQKTIYHFDLYRLRDIDEFLSMGFDEYFEADGICCIEWSERIATYLPPKSLYVFLKHKQEDQRLITITWKDHVEG
jgi:tRNA threonylcarbamoyladenosine biosynthesis protein TsaE